MRRVLLCAALVAAALIFQGAPASVAPAIADQPNLASFPGNKPLFAHWLSDGRLVAADSYCFNGLFNHYRFWESPDSGATWTMRVEYEGPEVHCATPLTSALPDGTSLYWVLGYQSTLYYSKVDFSPPPAGATSSAPNPPSPGQLATFATGNIISAPSIAKLDAGRLEVLVPQAVDAAGGKSVQTVWAYQSVDDGVTWTAAPSCMSVVTTPKVMTATLLRQQGGPELCVVYHYNSSGTAVLESYARSAVAWDAAQTICSGVTPTSAPVISPGNSSGAVPSVGVTNSTGIWLSEFRSGAWQSCRFIGAGKATSIAHSDSWSSAQEVLMPALLGPTAATTAAVWRSSPASSSVLRLDPAGTTPAAVAESHDGWQTNPATGDLIFELSDSVSGVSSINNSVGVSNDSIRLTAVGQKASSRFQPTVSGAVRTLAIWTTANAADRVRVGIQTDVSGQPSGTWVNSLFDPVTHALVAGAYFDVAATKSPTNPVSLSGTLTNEASLSRTSTYHVVMEVVPKTAADPAPSSTNWVAMQTVRALATPDAPAATAKFVSGVWTPVPNSVGRFSATALDSSVIATQAIVPGAARTLSSSSIVGEAFTTTTTTTVDSLAIPISGTPPFNYPLDAYILDSTGAEVWRAPFEIASGDTIAHAYGASVALAAGDYRLVLDASGSGLSSFYKVGTSTAPTEPETWGSSNAHAVTATSREGLRSRGVELNPNTHQAVTLFDAGSSDELLVGDDTPFSEATLRVSNPATRTPLAWEYFASGSWKPLATTTNSMSTAVSMSFVAPADWERTELGGEQLYWVRARQSDASQAGVQVDQLLGARVNAPLISPSESRSGSLPVFVPQSDGSYVVQTVPTSATAMDTPAWYDGLTAPNATVVDGGGTRRPHLAFNPDHSAEVVGNAFDGHIGEDPGDGFTLSPAGTAVAVKRVGTLEHHGTATIGDGVLFPAVLSDQDEYVRAVRDGIEEFAILRNGGTSTSLAWDVTDAADGSPLSISQIGEGYAVVKDQKVLLFVKYASAMDVNGDSVPVQVAIANNRLTVTVDTSAGNFPIAVDPGWTRGETDYTTTYAQPYAFRVRGYNFERCISDGSNCRTGAPPGGAFKQEATAMSHAIRKLAIDKGYAGRQGREIPPGLDWEVGDDPYDGDADMNPDCNSGLWRADIVYGENMGNPASEQHYVAEVKNYAYSSTVESQLYCYLLRFSNRDIRIARLNQLQQINWAVNYRNETTGEKWVAWAAYTDGHIYFAKWDDNTRDTEQKEAQDRSHQTGNEKITTYQSSKIERLIPRLFFAE
ncbi:MAG: hypothetical protein QOK28_1920 [Actinomycetota bacterium]|jgi:hypothetical protein